MKKVFFIQGVSVLVLVLTLVLASCGPDPVALPKIGAPKVEAKVITGGVLLSWPQAIDVQHYEVYRKLSSDKDAIPLSIGEPGDANDKGICEFFDVVSLSNKLESNTEYTYTVIAYPSASGVKDIGKWEKKFKTGTIPAQDSKVDAPTVDLKIDFGTSSFTITVTPPSSGNIPSSYWIYFYENSNYDNGIEMWTMSNPSTPFVWTAYGIQYGNNEERHIYELLEGITGEYCVEVSAQISNYFKSTSVIIKKVVEPLFGDNFRFSNGYNANYDAAHTTVTGYTANFSYGQLIYGVTYTVERADYNYDKNIYDDYKTITGASISAPDIFGNTTGTTKDDSLPVKVGQYDYRLKAVKDGITDYRYTWVQINPYNSLSASLTVGDNVSGSFNITPSVDYKGILQANDKVVLYWLVAAATDKKGFTTANSISFDKTYLESGTAKTMTPTVNNGTYTTLYVQAYLERADGKKSPVSIYGDNVNYSDEFPGQRVYVVTDY